ncbi:MAG: helix-turn-helix transcriptional regulator, partial [Flavobacterium sp.]
MKIKNPWEDPTYQKISKAQLSEDYFNVQFENGDKVKVSIESVLPFHQGEVDKSNFYFNSYELVLPSGNNSIEIPWDKIRVLTDPDFGKFLADKAEEQAKLIGKKLKKLREKNGMKSNDLAERAGITPQTISRIENGHTDIGFSTLRKILASMGYSLKDLASQELELESDVKPEKSYHVLLSRL